MPLTHEQEIQLTAYALDELDDAERQQVESDLLTSPDAQRYVEEVRATAAQLRTELTHELERDLAPAERLALVGAPGTAGTPGSPAKRPGRARRLLWLGAGLAAAACLGFAAGQADLWLNPTRATSRQVAAIDATAPADNELNKIRAYGQTPRILPPPRTESSGEDTLRDLHGRIQLSDAGKQGNLLAGGGQPVSREVAQVGAEGEAAGKSGNAKPGGGAGGGGIAGTTLPLPANPRGMPQDFGGVSRSERQDAFKQNQSFGLAGRRSSEVHFNTYTQAPVSQRRLHEISGEEAGLWRMRDRDAADFNTEAYTRITDNPFLASTDNPLSTFSIDVDSAAYSNVRRFLTGGQLPPKDAVRIEEMINYFTYRYSPPEGKEAEQAPFAAHVEVGPAPWNPRHRLVRVGLKGREIAKEQRPPANLVFLIDVSGSMQPENKLPLVKKSLKMLLDKLEDKDRVAIAVYAGSQGLVLPSTQVGPDNEKDLPPGRDAILKAIDHLESGGSTNGGAGIELAYKIASEAFIKDGVNRVILATDGDFNVGITNEGDLTRLIEDKAKSGVYLSVLGYGMGNLKDATLEKLADKGNGNYAYIDTLSEAKKVLVEQTGGTLVTIAKDVKIQVEFNPLAVSSYRLIGYENRVLAKEDFNDDTKDAGDIGAGHTVTALYEVVPATNQQSPATPVAGGEAVDPLKYQTRIAPTDAAKSGELLTLKLRYKAPDAQAVQGTSKLIEFPVKDTGRKLGDTSEDFRFASAVAAFGMLLRESPHKGEASFAQVLDLAGGAMGVDEHGYRAEFVELVRRAEALAKPAAATPPATQPQP